MDLLNTFYEGVSPSSISNNRNSDNLFLNGIEYDVVSRELDGSHRGGWDNHTHFVNDPWNILNFTPQDGDIRAEVVS